MSTTHDSAGNKGSCLKKVMMGCGCMTIMFCLGIGMITMFVVTADPVEPEQGTLKTTETFGANAEQPDLVLPGAVESKKPVKLYIDVGMLNFHIEPTKQPGEIEIEGDYDKANFDFTTGIEDMGDHIAYNVKFENKRSLLSMLVAGKGEGVEIDNTVVMRLPSDLLFDLELKMEAGEARVDLTDVAVRSLDLEMSKGEMIVSMGTPNKVPMESVKVDSEMGQTVIDDIQNLGMVKGRFEGSMGELLLRNSGPLTKDLDIELDMTMGSARLELPDNVEVKSKLKAVFGEVRNTRNKQDQEYTHTVTVKGKATMGELRVLRHTWKKPVSRILRETIRSKGVEAAVIQYRELRETHGDKYNFNEGILNSLGYEYMGRGDYDAAIAIFKLNVETHPQYANGYDSLGEGYMRAGQIGPAIANYEKSIELNPANSNGIRMLDRLREKQSPPSEETPPETPESPDPPNPN